MHEQESIQRAPKGLREQVIRNIHKIECARARLYMRLCTVAICVSSSYAALAAWSALSDVSRSDFLNYLSLLLSDTNVVLAYWKEYVLSLAEILPLTALTIFFVAIAVFLFSLRILVVNMRYQQNVFQA